MSPATKKKLACACPSWVTGPLQFHLETDLADETPLFFRILSPWPHRTAISRKMIRQHAEKVPGAMSIEKKFGGGHRVVFRVNNTSEMGYDIFGVCPCCDFLLLERN